VNLELSVVDVAGERTPARERVADRSRGVCQSSTEVSPCFS
jgi:hypothetical protein